MATSLLVRALDPLDNAAWSRPLVYNCRVAEGTTRLWIGRHTAHEGMHHLADIRAGLGSGAG